MFHAWNIDQGTARVRQAFARAGGKASAIERFAALAFLLLIGLLALIILIPIGLLIVAIGLILVAIRAILRLFSSARNPNGPLDGRRNVRVILPDEPGR